MYNYVYISTHVSKLHINTMNMPLTVGRNIPVFDNITVREVKKDSGYLHTGEFYTALFKQKQTTVLYVKKNGTIYYVFFMCDWLQSTSTIVRKLAFQLTAWHCGCYLRSMVANIDSPRSVMYSGSSEDMAFKSPHSSQNYGETTLKNRYNFQMYHNIVCL